MPDAPIDRLLERSSELAGGWLVALVEALPLPETPRIQVGELAAEGPALCAAAVSAMAGDAELQRLQVGGAAERLAARTAAIAGASAPDAISRAVDCLRAVIWAALREEFAEPTAEQLFEAAERLALIGELVRDAALRASAGPGELSVTRPQAAPARRSESSADEGGWEEGGWEQRLAEWVERAHEKSTALALLLAELEDVDRLLAVSSPEEASAALEAFAAAVRATAGEKGEVLTEGGRAWLIMPGLSRARAWGLGARVSAAVAGAGRWRGAPLKVSVGLAVLGQSGDDAPALIAAAEESRFAAQAGGSGPVG